MIAHIAGATVSVLLGIAELAVLIKWGPVGTWRRTKVFLGAVGGDRRDRLQLAAWVTGRPLPGRPDHRRIAELEAELLGAPGGMA